MTALVDNAIDHATATVDVGCPSEATGVLVEVRDDGPGLPETDQLFRRFASHRDARTSGDDRRHYGIGLALVAEVAAQHGGSVSASARTDGRPGAAVTLELPAAR